MINTERIVPITAIDLLSMYGLVLALALEAAPTKLDATTTDGQFTATESGVFIASEPVAHLDFSGEDVASSCVVYFVAAYNFSGFSINGAAVETDVDTVSPDDRTLYKAELTGDSGVAITKIGF